MSIKDKAKKVAQKSAAAFNKFMFVDDDKTKADLKKNNEEIDEKNKKDEKEELEKIPNAPVVEPQEAEEPEETEEPEEVEEPEDNAEPEDTEVDTDEETDDTEETENSEEHTETEEKKSILDSVKGFFFKDSNSEETDIPDDSGEPDYSDIPDYSQPMYYEYGYDYLNLGRDSLMNSNFQPLDENITGQDLLEWDYKNGEKLYIKVDDDMQCIVEATQVYLERCPQDAFIQFTTRTSKVTIPFPYSF